MHPHHGGSCSRESLVMTQLPTAETRFDHNHPDFQAVRLVEVELSEPLAAIAAVVDGRHYQRVQILVRLFTYPIGRVALDLDADGLDSTVLAEAIWQALHQEINDWLKQNAVPPVTQLDATGLKIDPDMPAFLVQRKQLLADAPLISVVVCTRDRTDQLSLALQRLLELDYPNFEILVIDNAPRTTATAELVEQTFGGNDQIRYIREDQPGLSIARNCGLQQAQGEYIAYTDDDGVIDPHWLTEVARSFQAGDRVACVTGPILPTELDTPAQLLSEQFRGRDMEFEPCVFDLKSHQSSDPLYPWAAGIYGGGGANMSFRTAVLHEMGGFDPALGAGTPTHGGEDLAIFVDLIKRGYQIAYEPGAIVYHAHRADYAALRRQLYGYGMGLTAYLIPFILRQPANLLDMLPKIGRAIYYMFDSKSSKNHKRTSSYPSELTWVELRGMVLGPAAYLYSRWRMAEKKPS